MQWGLGVEHEFNVSESSSPSAQTLVPTDVLKEYGYTSHFKSINNGQVSVVRAPAGADLDPKTIRQHLMHLAKMEGLFHTSKSSSRNASSSQPTLLLSPSSSLSLFLRKQKVGSLTTSIYRGDTLLSSCCETDLFMITVIPAERRPRTPLSEEDALRSLCALREVVLSRSREHKTRTRRFMCKDVDSTCSGAYDVDGPFLEARSTRYENATVAEVASQLHDAESAVLARAKAEGIDGAQIFPWSGRITPDGIPVYEGSFHIWITLPHDRSSDMTLSEYNRLLLQHAYLAHLLQATEPLLMSLFSGDPRALGDSRGRFSRASMRADVSPYAGYGTTAVKYIAKGPQAGSMSGLEVEWYESEADMVAGRGARKQRATSRLFVWIDGKKVPFTLCLLSNMRFGYYDPHPWENPFYPLLPLLDHGRGADIRSKLCDSFSGSLQQGWTPRWLRVRDTLELRFVSGHGTPAARVTRNAPINARRWGKDLVGIEFRALDNMPSRQIDKVLHFVVLLGAAAISQVDRIWPSDEEDPEKHAFFAEHSASLSTAWQGALGAVRKRGAHAPMPQAYTKYLAAQLGLPIASATATAFDTLQEVARRLHAEHKSHAVTRSMHPLSEEEGPPNFENSNQEAWEAMYMELDKKQKGIVQKSKLDAPYLLAMSK